MQFIVYRNTDGMILRTGECLFEVLSLQAQTGETAIGGEADDATEYINTTNQSVIARPSLTATWNKTTITANGTDTATLGSSLPNPTIVTVDVPTGAVLPDPEEVTAGSFSLATTISGDYTVRIYPPFPYMSITQVITAS